MQIQFTKRTDGTVSLRCVRDDGSATWERHRNNAVFYAFHDLTHYAVETTLGCRQGFYGLIAGGWDIPDTTGKGKRGKLPPGAILVEIMVGLLESERAGAAPPLSAREFNAQIHEIAAAGPSIKPLTDEQLNRARDRRDQLHLEWGRLSPGSILELTFGPESPQDGHVHAKACR